MKRRFLIPRSVWIIPLLALLSACGGGGGGGSSGGNAGTTCVWGSSNWGGCSWGS